jgi:hypothetical protein
MALSIYDQFQLPIENGERRAALHASVKAWFEHDSCPDLGDIIQSLRSVDDVVSNRPLPVESTQEILDSFPYLYSIAFKWEQEINNDLELPTNSN